MYEEKIEPILKKDPGFRIIEGSPMEIADQMPSDVLKDLALHTISSNLNNQLNAILINGTMVKLNKKNDFVYTVSYKEKFESNMTTPHVKRVEKTIRGPLKGEVMGMEINPKEYIDDRIDILEKSIDHRLDANEKLLTEKIDHLHTKLEGSIERQFTAFKTELLTSQKNQTNNNRTNLLAIIGIATAIIIGAVSYFN